LWDGGSRHVADVLQSVARQYIFNNQLFSLNRNDRRLVAATVFQMLEESSRRPDDPYLPMDSDVVNRLNNPSIATSSISLLEINAMTSKNRMKLSQGERYSLSISSALSIVTMALLRLSSAFGAGWSGFEVKTALMEAQHIMKQEDLSQPNAEVASPQIDAWKSAFPAAASRTTFVVPALAKDHIYINGPAALFADVIAPYRICQCKHSLDGNGTALLNLEEFMKLGVLNITNELNRTLGKDP